MKGLHGPAKERDSRPQMRMLLEESPHEIVTVAEPVRPRAVREEKNPRDLEAARRQDELLRGDAEPLGVRSREADGADAAARVVRLDLQRARMEVHVEIRRRAQLGTERLAEPQALVLDDVEDDVLELRGIEARSATARARERGLPRPEVVSARPETAGLIGSLVVRIEVAPRDRPPAVRDPGPVLEVERVERARPAAPVIRRAPEEAQTRSIEGEVRDPDDLALVQRGRGARRVETSGLEQRDAERLSAELARQDDPGGAAADDADVGLDDGVGRQTPGVEEQTHFLRGRGSAPS